MCKFLLNEPHILASKELNKSDKILQSNDVEKFVLIADILAKAA